MLEQFLAEALLVIAAAVAVVVVCAEVRIPPLVGLLLAGLLIGPSGLALVSEKEQVEVFAEIGVVLLLFTIGLELSLKRLGELRRSFFLGGSLQAAATTAVVAVIAVWLAGLPVPVAVFLGFLATLSSTAVVLKLYGERRETDSPHGGLVLSVLLFQDFLIVPLIVLTPVLAGKVEATVAEVVGRFGLSLVLVAAVFAAALWVVPAVLRHLVRARIREALVLTALGLCLGAAWLTHGLGFSMALGAFLAGIVVSETEYSHQVVADVGPFRDVLASLFFVSVGMLVELSFVVDRWPLVLGIAAAIVTLKALTGGGAALGAGYPIRIAVLSGLGLAQMGEFSFVLMEVGRAHGLLSADLFQLALSSAVLTLFLTPALVGAAPAVAAFMARWLSRAPAPSPEVSTSRSGHVVIVGFGVAGRLLARVLAGAGIPYVAVELNGNVVRRARQEGRSILYGDATRPEILTAAGVPDAKVLVFALSDPLALSRSVRLARELNRSAEIVVRARRVEAIGQMRQAGADEVVAEELEAALKIFTEVLERYHVPRNVVRAQVRALRAEGYEMLLAPAPGRAASRAALEALEAGTTELFLVASGSHAAGRTLAGLELRRRSGASVIALVRGERSHPNPSPEIVLEAGDTLVLVGSHREIDQAFEVLEDRGPL